MKNTWNFKNDSLVTTINNYCGQELSAGSKINGESILRNRIISIIAKYLSHKIFTNFKGKNSNFTWLNMENITLTK